MALGRVLGHAVRLAVNLRNMRILAIDTSTECCSAALLLSGELRLQQEVTDRGHAMLILPMVERLLAEAELGLRSLDGIAFGRGPGAFTGLRIAVGVAQGLGLGANLPVVGVSSLAAVADQVGAAQGEGVMVCNDARMGEVYRGDFCRDQSGSLVTLAAETATDPARLLVAANVVHAAGNGLSKFPELMERLLARAIKIHGGLYPRADAVARLAVGRFESGTATSASEALPVYVRDDVARPPAAAVTDL
jgi:tRNA threonylcarbamoyladenosine biosynthesis protein TsaB